MKKILVIGAGLGGLAAAIRLARAGHAVEVWEKNAEAGGKLKEVRDGEFRWDTGPSLLTMPDVLRDLYASAGERLEDHLDLVRLESACRYFWTDGTVIDEDAAFWGPARDRALPRLRARHLRALRRGVSDHPPSEMWRAFTPRNLGKLRHLPKVATTQTLAREVYRRISDPHLRQIFLRFATYNGSSPYQTPATFNIIPYVEATFGPWYVRGGMVKIARELQALAERNGVGFRFNTTATAWSGSEATAHDGAASRADILICNADVLTARGSFLSNPRELANLTREPLSTSGFILFLGVRGRDPRLSHHNIFFSDDYQREAGEIHQRKIPPGEPTIYIASSVRTDSTHAPEGQDNWFILVNAPARDPNQPWTAGETRGYGELVLERLGKFGFDDLPSRVIAKHAFTPTDFATRDLAPSRRALWLGPSHSIRTSLLRPPLRAPGMKNVYFTGGTTHPGGGIPLVLLSGKMVAEMIQREAA